VGVGVTPSAWLSTSKAIEIGAGGAFESRTNLTLTAISNNSYTNTGGTNIYKSTGFALRYYQYDGQHVWQTAPSGTAGNAITFTQAMTLDASGRLGIGTTTPSNVLDVAGASGSLARFKSTGNYSTVIADNTSTTGGGAFACYKQGAQIGLFGVDGAVLGNTSTDIAIFAETGSSLRFYTNGSGTVKMTIGTGGIITSPATYSNTSAGAANMFVQTDGTFYRSTSSLKYKNNVQDATHGLADLLQLRSITYEGKAETDAGKTFGGLIAEEVHAAGLTEFVQYAEDGSPDALAYGNMVSLCIKAIQEQNQLITQLTARITALEAK
jgi:hypothetical protein